MYAVFFPLNQLTFHSNSTADEEVLKTLASLSFALNFVPDKESLSSNHYIHSTCVLGISVKSGAELMEEVEMSCQYHSNLHYNSINFPWHVSAYVTYLFFQRYVSFPFEAKESILELNGFHPQTQ